jgi:SanA protein
MAWARLLAKAVIVALAFGVAATLTAWELVERKADPRIFTSVADVPPARAGLVLGTSRWLPGRTPNPYFDKRIEAAAKLFEAGKVEYLIVSGNQSQGGRPNGGYDEPNDMRDALVAEGVPAERIYRDYAGFRTLDSILRASRVFGQDRIIVISQHFHLARALYLAAQHGLPYDGFEAEGVPWQEDVRTQLREAGARLRAVLDTTLGSGPRFGGAPIALGVDPPS